MICFVYYKDWYLECLFSYLLFSGLHLFLCLRIGEICMRLNTVISFVFKGSEKGLLGFLKKKYFLLLESSI